MFNNQEPEPTSNIYSVACTLQDALVVLASSFKIFNQYAMVACSDALSKPGVVSLPKALPHVQPIAGLKEGDMQVHVWHACLQ